MKAVLRKTIEPLVHVSDGEEERLFTFSLYKVSTEDKWTCKERVAMRKEIRASETD